MTSPLAAPASVPAEDTAVEAPRSFDGAAGPTFLPAPPGAPAAPGPPPFTPAAALAAQETYILERHAPPPANLAAQETYILDRPAAAAAPGGAAPSGQASPPPGGPPLPVPLPVEPAPAASTGAPAPRVASPITEVDPVRPPATGRPGHLALLLTVCGLALVIILALGVVLLRRH
jgi:hypothetical protein